MAAGRSDISRREALRRVVAMTASAALAASGLSACRRLMDEPAAGGSTAADGRRSPLHIACTGCGECEPCPYGVEIARTFAAYNAAVDSDRLPDPRQQRPSLYRRLGRQFLNGYRRRIGQFGRADRCIGCRQCEPHCPEHLDIKIQLRRVEALVAQLEADEMSHGR